MDEINPPVNPPPPNPPDDLTAAELAKLRVSNKLSQSEKEAFEAKIKEQNETIVDLKKQLKAAQSPAKKPGFFSQFKPI